MDPWGDSGVWILPSGNLKLPRTILLGRCSDSNPTNGCLRLWHRWIRIHGDQRQSPYGPLLQQSTNGCATELVGPGKKCYGIFYGVRLFEDLLDNKPFILKTDHKNLTNLSVTLTGKVLRWKLYLQDKDFYLCQGGSPRGARCTLQAMWKPHAIQTSNTRTCGAVSNPVLFAIKAITTRHNIRQDSGGTQFQHGPWGTAFDTEANKRPLDNWPDDQSIHSAVHMWSGPAMTPQYVLHTLMHCTYYTVSLTCTVHCT